MDPCNHQDWTPVIFNKNNNSKKKPTLNDGSSTIISKPVYNKNNSGQFIKEDEETGMVKINTYGTEYGKKVQQARCEKQLKQKDLAIKLNVKEDVVREIENGKGKVDGLVCSKIFSILGVKRND